MVWPRQREIVGFVLASLAALGCEAEIAGHAVPDASGGGSPDGASGGAGQVAPGASRFLQDAVARATPLRRLTRSEYGNIVHELFGVEAPAPALLPDDSLSSGFTSTVGQLMTIASANRYVVVEHARARQQRIRRQRRGELPAAGPGQRQAQQPHALREE